LIFLGDYQQPITSMGFIYLAASPTLRCYVGQTIGTISARWRRHIYDAYADTEHGCPKLNKAIRKHGASAFLVLELWTCADAELDEWEIFFIGLFEAYSRGYNLTAGGQQSRVYSEESRERMSASHRTKFYLDWPLPYGLTYITSRAGEGFRLRFKGHDLQYTHAEKTMQEKYEEALRDRRRLEAGEVLTQVPGRPRGRGVASLPKYVYYDEKREAYFVHKPGHPRKFFMSQKCSKERRLEMAIQHLESSIVCSSTVRRLRAPFCWGSRYDLACPKGYRGKKASRPRAHGGGVYAAGIRAL
jgi:group I intron endonuclease